MSHSREHGHKKKQYPGRNIGSGKIRSIPQCEPPFAKNHHKQARQGEKDTQDITKGDFLPVKGNSCDQTKNGDARYDHRAQGGTCREFYAECFPDKVKERFHQGQAHEPQDIFLSFDSLNGSCQLANNKEDQGRYGYSCEYEKKYGNVIDQQPVGPKKRYSPKKYRAAYEKVCLDTLSGHVTSGAKQGVSERSGRFRLPVSRLQIRERPRKKICTLPSGSTGRYIPVAILSPGVPFQDQ